jgi:Tol biopolymer transport system component
MALHSGTKLGPYEILSLIGAGGMGEVYKASDPRLNRTVAIKVLGERISSRPDLRQRFEREAQTIARLNHPHICVIHDVGHQDGLDYLVMEHLDGQTLAERLLRGPMPVDEALRCAMQIADALDKAHREGVIHRDLKPANIMLTPSGPKLLDFGLAKLRPPEGSATPVTVSAMPTDPHNLTIDGAILGTLQYMPPEQLEGKEADARSDIFAFGATLFEMVTGKRAFEGKSQVSLMAAILEHDPKPLSQLLPTASPTFERMLQTCLEKDPENRLQTMREVSRELKWIAHQARESRPVVEPSSQARGRRSHWAGWIVAFVLMLVAAGFAAAYFLHTPPAPLTVRFSVNPPAGTNFAGGGGAPRMAISPDGSQLAFGAGPTDATSALWIYRLDSGGLKMLPGTEGVQQPFWSADGKFIGFWQDSKIKRIDPSGGGMQTLCEAPSQNVGGDSNLEGTILFGGAAAPIMRVSAGGGVPQPVTTLDSNEGAHLWPRFLTDGDQFLYFAAGQKPEESAVYVGSLKSSQKKRLMLSRTMAHYASPGYLLFVRDEALVAQPFDIQRLEFTGEPVSVSQTIAYVVTNGRIGVTTSDNGVVAFRETPGSLGADQLTWFDRTGKPAAAAGKLGSYWDHALSPNGKQVAVSISGPQGLDLWITDLLRGISSRLTSDPAAERSPVWSPAGNTIVFSSNRGKGINQLYLKAATGFGAERLLLPSDRAAYPSDWSADGRLILYQVAVNGTSRDIYALPATGDGKPVPIQTTSFDEFDGRLSADGRWLAFVSNASGPFQVYVRSFPGEERQWQISREGGLEPRWHGDGKELFFRAPDGTLMVAQTNIAAGTDPGVPARLFQPNISSSPAEPQYASRPMGNVF